MPTHITIAVLTMLAVHAALGVVFAAWFLTRGIARLDPAARGSGSGFRLLIAPGVVALWPVLAIKSLWRKPPAGNAGASA